MYNYWLSSPVPYSCLGVVTLCPSGVTPPPATSICNPVTSTLKDSDTQRQLPHGGVTRPIITRILALRQRYLET
ncbi:hypothetical protein Plhal703r1_c31g0121411 [Plasmopara halstedii]